jgi:hypothetical protein
LVILSDLPARDFTSRDNVDELIHETGYEASRPGVAEQYMGDRIELQHDSSYEDGQHDEDAPAGGANASEPLAKLSPARRLGNRAEYNTERQKASSNCWPRQSNRRQDMGTDIDTRYNTEEYLCPRRRTIWDIR